MNPIADGTGHCLNLEEEGGGGGGGGRRRRGFKFFVGNTRSLVSRVKRHIFRTGNKPVLL
jgi:hypothetical protein